ncbi:MAG TPA: FAD-dependent oxidoreductase [Candidatus Angelobacter sp.]|nr:FAD-dependent oxidoreductase [Candidatus Angelobacter sp.]
MSKRILVIGGGVIGLSTAYYCARKGHHVTVVDRNPEQRDGCSFGNAGMIVPSHFIPLAAPGMVALGLKWMWNPESPFYIKPRPDRDLVSWAYRFWRASTPGRVRRAAPLLRDLQLASRACFEEFADLTGNSFGLVKRGLLMLCKTQHALDEEAKMAEQAGQLGIPAEVLDARQTAALDPDVRMDVAGAVYFPKDCHLSPDRFMAGLQQRLKQAGAEFSWNTEVTGWRASGSRIEAARTTVGEFTGDEFVLCGGVWSPDVARELRLHLPMQAGKGYSLTLTRPRQLPRICALFAEARLAVTPMGGSLRFGGTMEIAGLNEDINPVRVRGIIKSVPRYYPDFTPHDFDGVEPWRGLRPCSPDGLPYVGRTARHSNLCVAAGHAMLGLSLGPITGRLVAEILSGENPSIPINLLDPDRYA